MEGRPVLGLKPRAIHESQRIDEIKTAILRYLDSGYEVPVCWIEEYNELISSQQKHIGHLPR